MADRVLRFEGIHNFRDYGGYRARHGTLRRGVLWRSGHHATATPHDLDRVHDLAIATVIDLRGDSERTAFPCQRHGAFEGAVLFHPGETASLKGRAAHEEHADAAMTVDDARGVMVRLYQGMPFRDVLVETWRLYFAALAQRDGASLLHCLAGKDRTGVGVALVHHALGVHPDDIMADYLLTNTAGDVDARIAAQGHSLSGMGLPDAALRVILGVDAPYLDAAFASMAERHGSVDGYLAQVMGVGPAEVARLEQRLLA